MLTKLRCYSALSILCIAFCIFGEEPPLVCVSDSTRKVCQLTGDTDRETKLPTLTQTGKNFGILGTDLGSSFEHKGKVYFLFGDTAGRPGDEDALGWTDSADPEKIVLDFHRRPDGKWLAPVVPGIKQGAFEIPSGGCSIDGVIYVAFTTGHTEKVAMGSSVLAQSTDDGRTFTRMYELSRDKFINVSFLRDGDWLYVYGSGEYRKSSVRLARVKASEIADRLKLQFFSGTDPDGTPRWDFEESNATPLFNHNVVGEFSVAYLEPFKRYVMLYNSDKSGIVMRSSPSLHGKWSDAATLFDKWKDKGYTHFIHAPPNLLRADDKLADPNRVNEWGGAYGPYIMSRYASATKHGECRIYFTMSTWNPYQVVVMRSDLKLAAQEK